jgi:type I restriction enzyme S subunit
MAGSAGQKRVQKDFIASYRIALPPLSTQKDYVGILTACDRELDLLARKRDALRRQQRGLMQQLLTGRIRVKV